MVSQLAFFTSLAEAIKKFLLRIIRPNPQSWWDLLPVQDFFACDHRQPDHHHIKVNLYKGRVQKIKMEI